MPSVWHALIGDAQYGPFSSAEMKQMVRRGTLQPTNFVWREGLNDWIPGIKVQGLFPDGVDPVPARPVGIADVLQAKIEVAGGVPGKLSKQVFVGAAPSTKLLTKLCRAIGVPVDTPIRIGFVSYLALTSSLYECAGVFLNKLAVCHDKNFGQYDIRRVRCSMTRSLWPVHLEASGYESFKLTTACRPFFEWLMPLVPACLPPIPEDGELTIAEDSAVPVQLKKAATQKPMQKADINNDGEGVLAELPGVGVVLAKKAIAVRTENGGFNSLEDFAAAIGLKPHIVERLRPLVVLGACERTQPSMLKGRVIDY